MGEETEKKAEREFGVLELGRQSLISPACKNISPENASVLRNKLNQDITLSFQTLISILVETHTARWVGREELPKCMRMDGEGGVGDSEGKRGRPGGGFFDLYFRTADWKKRGTAWTPKEESGRGGLHFCGPI